MKIRGKVVTLLSAVFVALVLAQWSVGQAVLVPRFEQIELDNARTAMMRIENGVHQALAGLQVSANDWGNWADTYRYARDRNAAYVRDNLHVTAMKQLHLTALAFIAPDGKFIWSQALDPASEARVALDLFARSTLPADFPWWENLRLFRAAHGLIVTNRGVMLAAVSPILDGFGHGPALGMILMGRLLTEAELAEIGARAQTRVVMTALRKPGAAAPRFLPHNDLARTTDEVLATAGATQVYRAFKDVYGQPALTLRIDVPREITAGARSTVLYAMAFTVAAAVAALLMMMLLLDRIVLGPVAQVTRHAITIGAGDDLTPRLNLARRDEVGALAREFDRMVEQLAESRRQLVDHSFHAGMAEFSQGVLHNIGNAMTPLGVRVAKLQERLRKAPTADVERALAERRRPADDPGRQADLDEFLRLASGELAQAIKAVESDASVMARQAAIVQGALADQLRSARGPTVVEALELPAVIQQSLEIVPDACRAAIDLELDASVQAVGVLRLARTVLRLVLQNLIINAAEAVRAAASGRGVVRFTAMITRGGGREQLLLECADTGVGIATENLERVFERGYSTKHGAGNLGIGLHWCATAVNALGGRIWATSDGPGRGATLHLLIPLPAPAAVPSTAAA